MSAEAEAAYNNDDGDDDAASKAIFFVADGLRQDMVEKYAGQRNVACRNMRTLLRNGVKAAGRRLADRGAAQHGRRLVQPGDGCLAGRARLDQQHLPHQRPALQQPHRRLRPGRAAGREPGPGGRARRQEGGPDRVGRRARGLHPTARRSTTARSTPAAASPPTTSAPPTMPTSWPRLVSSSTTRQALPARPPSPAPPPRTPAAGPMCPKSYSPAKEMRLRVLDFGTDKYGLNAYIYDSTNDNKVNYDRVLLSFSKDGSQTAWPAAQGPVGRCQGQDRRRRARQGKTAGMLVKVEELTPDLSQVRLFHTSVDPRHRVLAHLGWRSGLHGARLRRVHRPEVPHLDGRRLCHSRGGYRQRGDLCPAGRCTGKSLYHPLIRYILQELQARPGDGRLPDDRRVPAPVPGLVSPTLPNGAAEPGL